MTQSANNAIRQLAKDDVEATFPNVYRADEDVRNHGYAIAQHEVQNSSTQNSLSVQEYAEKYIAAYRQAVEERDAQ